MIKKRKICILSFSNIAWDSRVLREIEMASRYYQVDVIGYGKWDPLNGVRYFPLQRKNVFPIIKYLLLFGGLIIPKLFDIYFWLKPQYQKALTLLNNGKYDLVHANDWDSLPVASQYGQSSNCKIIFDAHEYSIANRQRKIINNLLIVRFRDYLFSKYQKNITRMITVSEGLKNLYAEKYGWKMDVILNAPKYIQSRAKKTDGDNIRIVHHGGALPLRGLEIIIHLMAHLQDRFSLTFFLIPYYPGYLRKLKDLARETAPNRIFFKDPIKPENITKELNQYDIGIHYLKPDNLNHINALPNKLFDFMMAGLVVVMNPLPMIKKVIDDHQLGVFISDSNILETVEEMNSLTSEQIDNYKKHSLAAAKKMNAEIELKKLHNIYKQLCN